MPQNPPKFCSSETIPVQVVFFAAITDSGRPCARKVFSSTQLKKSKLKKPMPHRPTTPAKASVIPTSVFFRQRGVVNSSGIEPSFTHDERACGHCSGSL